MTGGKEQKQCDIYKINEMDPRVKPEDDKKQTNNEVK